MMKRISMLLIILVAFCGQGCTFNETNVNINGLRPEQSEPGETANVSVTVNFSNKDNDTTDAQGSVQGLP